MVLLPNTLITADDFSPRDEPPCIEGWQHCAPGWFEFEISLDPLSAGADACLHVERRTDRETLSLGFRRTSLIYSSQAFSLNFAPARPVHRSSYTIYTMSLQPIGSDELENRFDRCLFGDRRKTAELMNLGNDEDRWRALQDFVAQDTFYSDDLGLYIEQPRDFSWEGGGLIRSHSSDPHFLASPRDLPGATTLLHCKIDGSGGSTKLLPRIIVSDASGDPALTTGIRFSAVDDNSASERIVHMPRDAKLKVYPACGAGSLRIASIQFARSSVASLIAKTVTAFIFSGYREIPSLLQELRQQNEIPPTTVAHGENTPARQAQRPVKRGMTSKIWFLYRRFSGGRITGEPTAAPGCQDLASWLHEFLPSPLALNSYRNAMHSLGLETRFTIICPLHRIRPEALDIIVESILGQIYAQWELLLVGGDAETADVPPFRQRSTDPRIRLLPNEPCSNTAAALNDAVRHATGDYLVLLPTGGALEKHALFKFASAIRSEAPDILYSDEYTSDKDGGIVNHVSARPAFSIDQYLSHPCDVDLTCVSRELVQTSGPFDESLEQQWLLDFNLRCIENAQVVTHVPDCLFRRQIYSDGAGDCTTKNDAEPTIAAIERHLARTGRDATVRVAQRGDVFDVRDRVPADAKVAVIIPTKNNARLLKKAVDSCTQKSGDIDIEIFIVDHASDDEATRHYLAQLTAQSVATVLPYEGSFNFSRINNRAVAEVQPDVSHYLFLNNDVEARSEHWIEAMAATCSRADVGVCGAMLLYPDDRIQHGGVTVGYRGAAEHTYKWVPYYDSEGRVSGAHDYALVARRDCMAVTAAAMMVRADVFQEIGGYDEQLEVGFNDTDLCLRIFEHGYKILFDANVVLWHFESATRGTVASDPHPDDTRRFRKKHRKWIDRKDLFYGAHLSFASTSPVFDETARSEFSRPRTIKLPGGCYGKRRIDD